MPNNFKNQLFLDHIVLISTDLKSTKAFYTKIFGKPQWSDKEQMMLKIDKTKLFLVKPWHKLPKNYHNQRAEMDHLAFGVKSLKQLREIQTHLNKNNIEHSGIHIDVHSKKEKIWLNDPNGIRLEFFLTRL